MIPDPKWLEVLKASGWQTGMLALAFIAFLALARLGLVTVEPWMIAAVVLGALVCGALWLASVGKAALEAVTVPTRQWVRRRLALRRAKRAVAKYIPFMTPREKQIIAYLLHYNQKSFDVMADYGHAASLVGRGIVVMNAVHKQYMDFEHIPVKIPDHVWEVLVAHRDQFPYEPELDDDVEVHPWRKGWAD